MTLILASASPRRAELLRGAGFAFQVVPADVDETPLPGELPQAYVLRVARDKAMAVASQIPESAVILAADTAVVAKAEILGKPVDTADAHRMLQRLSGAVHEVHTGVALKTTGNERVEVVTTRVWFRPLDEAEIDWYIASGEPEGKAGGYAIQGRAARFVERIEGSWSNVVGLPIADVYRMLKAVSVQDILEGTARKFL